MAQPGAASMEPRETAMRSLRRRLNRQEIEELVTRYIAGETIRALSREYGVSRSGLRQLLRGEGVALREQGITPEDAERAVRLYESGLTIRQVVAIRLAPSSECSMRRVLCCVQVGAGCARRWINDRLGDRF